MINQPLIVENLTKKFNIYKTRWPFFKTIPFVAVDNISFNLQQGEILGFLGPNGAGKTTTIQMLLNLLTPTTGTIKYFGKNLYKNPQALQHISYASGYMKLPSSLTVYQALFMYGMLYNINYKTLKKKVEEFLDIFNLRHLASRKTFTLSAGQTTAVLLARTFLVNPKIVLLDEPTATLDPEAAQRIRAFISAQNKVNNVSILFTSHNMGEVEDLCDRILVLKNGTIIADGTPEYLASTVSVAYMQLIVGEQTEETVSYLKEKELRYQVGENHITIEIDESKIAKLLSGLAGRDIEVSQISIAKPTLEDYFLSLVQQTKFSKKRPK